MFFLNRRKAAQPPTSENAGDILNDDDSTTMEDEMHHPSRRSTTVAESSMNNNNISSHSYHESLDESDNASGASDAPAMMTPAVESTASGSTSTRVIAKRKSAFSKQKPKPTNGVLSRLSKTFCNPKKLILALVAIIFATIIWESVFVDPNNRLIQPDFSDHFLEWVETHPLLGIFAILIVIAGAVISMVPIGTPLTLGCGYIYRGVYGWKLGLFVSTVVSMAGSTLGAVGCFLLGRYLMRDTVKRWVRNYPLFDAIDVAASQHGLKIMAMLYLTPVLPLGLVSYACGTTTMDVSSFALAKIASLPLYLLYTFIGASAHSFIQRGAAGSGTGIGQSVSQEAKKLEENQTLLIAGLVLSVVMMTLITRHIRKELMKILDQQKKEKMGVDTDLLLDVEGDDANDKTIEMGLTSRARRKTNKNSKN